MSSNPGEDEVKVAKENMEDPFFKAILKGDLNAIDLWLANDVNRQNFLQEPEKYFMKIGESGNLKVLKHLLSLNEIKNIISSEDALDKILAIKEGNPVTAESTILIALLLREDSALRMAANKGHLDFVNYLIELIPGAQDKLGYNDIHLLHIAASFGHLKDVKALLEKEEVRKNMMLGAEDAGVMPLIRAIENGQIDVVNFLLTIPEIVANIYVPSNLELNAAVRNGNLDIFNALLNIPQVEATVTLGDPSLQYAWNEQNRINTYNANEILKRFLEVKNVIDTLDFHVVYWLFQVANPEVIEQLLKIPSAKKEVTDSPEKFVIIASERGNLEILEQLLKIKEVSDMPPHNYYDILFNASQKGDLDIVNRLLKVEGVTAILPLGGIDPLNRILEVAAAFGQLAVVDRLLEIPEVRKIEFKEHRALSKAIGEGNSSIIFRLLHAYKSAGIKFPYGQVPKKLFYYEKEDKDKLANYDYDEFYKNFPRLLQEAREDLRERMRVDVLAQLVEEYAEEKGEKKLRGKTARVNLKDYDLLAKYIQEKEASDRAERARAEAKEISERAQGPESHAYGAKPGGVGKLVEKFQRAIDEEDKEHVKKGPGGKKPKGK